MEHVFDFSKGTKIEFSGIEPKKIQLMAAKNEEFKLPSQKNFEIHNFPLSDNKLNYAKVILKKAGNKIRFTIKKAGNQEESYVIGWERGSGKMSKIYIS